MPCEALLRKRKVLVISPVANFSYTCFCGGPHGIVQYSREVRVEPPVAETCSKWCMRQGSDMFFTSPHYFRYDQALKPTRAQKDKQYMHSHTHTHINFYGPKMQTNMQK